MLNPLIRLFSATVALIMAFSCALDQGRAEIIPLRPPRLVGLVPRDAQTLILDFDQSLLEAQFELWESDFPLTGQELSLLGSTLVVSWGNPASPGCVYRFTLSGQNEGGLEMSYQGSWRAPNLEPAQLQIHEVNVAGSGARPDWIELKVLKKGNLGGLLVLTGQGSKSHEYRFPALEVKKGDFLLLHYKNTGTEGEKDELVNQNTASGPETHPEAWDFWAADSPGLIATRGHVVLDGDALFYDNKVLEPLPESPGLALWFGPAFDPTGTTATRTLVRKSPLLSPSKAGDWAIGASGMSSPGRENTRYYYQKP